MNRSQDADALLPLTHLTYHVLLVMADRPLHGYAIIQEVEQRTGGVMAVEAGTLYAAIKRMVEEGLIEPVPGEGSSRRRSYRVTEFGRAVLKAETGRLSELLELARGKDLLPQEGS